jgi:hypothetical protein
MLSEIAKATESRLDNQEKAKLRAAIQRLEDILLQKEQADIVITNHFSHGVYAREMFVPKGTLLTGKIHKFKNMNIISQGEVSFFSTDGGFRCKAPHSFVASPGVKRVIYAHEDTVWTTIHGTDETDVDKIEDTFTTTEYSEVPGIDEDEIRLIEEAKKCLGL